MRTSNGNKKPTQNGIKLSAINSRFKCFSRHSKRNNNNERRHEKAQVEIAKSENDADDSWIKCAEYFNLVVFW